MPTNVTPPPSLDQIPNGRLILITIVAMLFGSVGLIVSNAVRSDGSWTRLHSIASASGR